MIPITLRIWIIVTFTVVPSLVIAQQPSPSPTASPVQEASVSFPTPAPEAMPPMLTAKAAVLFDAHTGKVLLRHNENEPRQVASTQKLLTALIVAESGDLDKKVVIDKSDTMVLPTKLGLHAGETYTRQGLLVALLVKSANDVAVALARDNAGSVAAFAEKMNRRMAELKGTSSHFENPNGLPCDTQYSTARDMAIVARAAYANPIVHDIVHYRTISFKFNSGKTVIIPNTNHLLRDYSFCNGMKTGYTEKAGHCLIASGSWRGREVIAVILGEPARSKIWKDGQSLLVYGLGLTPEEVAASRLTKAAVAKKVKKSSSTVSGRRKHTRRT
ncbi:MAG: D-alanyl-D-alanine carboxypeptidase [Verrucomicrobia bacterium]|nr:MAG: D-alanyl-D-alanine carboxypeptidase [Verrucomicrobiota bacterium]